MAKASVGENSTLRLRIAIEEEGVRYLLEDLLSGVEIERVCQAFEVLSPFIDSWNTLSQKGHAARDEVAAFARDFRSHAVPHAFRDQLSHCRRIILNLKGTSLERLPWELMLSLNTKAPAPLMVRECEGVEAPRTANPYPSVLLVSANPGSHSYGKLAAADQELESVLAQLAKPQSRRYEVEALKGATPKQLQQRLAGSRYDVVHFICHADCSPTGSYLVLEGAVAGKHELVYAGVLADWLRQAGVSLVVFSGCKTAGLSVAAGSQLVKHGIGSVVGMQLPLSDASAPLFSCAFYAALAVGRSLAEAVAQGRQAISGCGLDWAAPVLVTSSFSHDPFLNIDATSQTNLPLDQGAFYGREDDVRVIEKLLCIDKERLVTVRAMGGMGKTRLATRIGQIMAAKRDSFPDGVWWIACESLTNTDELFGALASALDLDALPKVAEIVKALKARRMLLILDCFEELASDGQGCAAVASILQDTRFLQILVTSRVLLGLQWEKEHELKPLGLPRKGSKSSAGLDLFVSAAERASSDFRLSNDSAPLVRSVVALLEGIPLALLLAARCLKHLTVEQLHKRLEANRIEILRERSSRVHRHSSISVVLEASLRLLSQSQQDLAKALSVFVGGFFLEDAKAVLPDRPGLEDGIYELRDHSLLTSQEIQCKMRYRALDTVREYVEQVADQDELAPIRSRHAAHYVNLATLIRDRLDSGEWTSASEDLWREAGNFRAATRFAVASEDVSLIRSYGGSLARVYLEAGITADFAELAAAAEKIAEAIGDYELIAELRGLQGTHALRTGDEALAERYWRDRIEICRSLGDVSRQADTTLDIANLHLRRERLDRVEQLLEEFFFLDDRHMDPGLRASGRLVAALAAFKRREFEKAKTLMKEVEELAAGLEIKRSAFYVWVKLSDLQTKLGDLSKAEALSRKMIGAAMDASYFHTAGHGLLQLATVLEKSNRVELAAIAIATAEAIPRSYSPTLRKDASARRAKLVAEHSYTLTPALRARLKKDGWIAAAKSFANDSVDPDGLCYLAPR